ncbi:PTS sugar transporter subunit IIA [Leptogranulimonas caecicola]|uniref:PTS sugar transporter subunit IIA n=1 Tax=Leptogranulimonas caecicola TaxID=2894156 RepID=A0AAU9C246_9ACTN|nr:PTS sugar transporter subunit IIA [Leptogranulimonas caecicola]BCV19510.1 PTS sugar transporter subunit IIA [Atopobiaceae bacterium P1]BDC90173.1 PTS sugar transporter subunit IIA [Leptogranulimonas caecicola]
MSDQELFSPDLVFFDLEAADRQEFFEKLAERLAERDLIQDSWLEAICEREKNYATGLSFPSVQVAIPHVDPEHIKRPYIAVIKPKTPIVFEAMAGMGDDVPAQLIVNLGVMRDGGQVAVLQKLMNIFMNEGYAAQIMAASDPQQVVDAFTSLFSEVSAE